MCLQVAPLPAAAQPSCLLAFVLACLPACLPACLQVAPLLAAAHAMRTGDGGGDEEGEPLQVRPLSLYTTRQSARYPA
jgi:hypothetical protein